MAQGYAIFFRVYTFFMIMSKFMGMVFNIFCIIGMCGFSVRIHLWMSHFGISKLTGILLRNFSAFMSTLLRNFSGFMGILLSNFSGFMGSTVTI